MVSEHPLAMPSETLAAMGDRDRSESAPPLLHNNYGTTVFHAPNGPDVPGYDYQFGVDPRLPRQSRKGGNWSPGVVPGDGGGGGRGVNLGANRSGLFMDNGFGRVTGLDTGTHNNLGEIFQGSLSYPNPSPTGGLNSNISSTNMTASSNGLDQDASNNYGSILGSPLSKNGSPDPEIAMRVPSPCLPPIGVKLTSSNRRMVTNGSSTFSNASFGLDINDQMISAISALNLQGTNASHGFIGGQADSSNIIGSYAELDRSNIACSPISRNFTPLQESNACTKMHVHGAPFMFQQTGNGGCASPETSWQQLCLLEYIKKYEDGGPMRKMTRQQQIMQQLCSPSADHGYAYGYMPDFVFPSLPTGDQIGSGDYGMMGFLPNLRKMGSFSNHIPTLLEEFKSNKTGCYELSEIIGHVVEFSMDQHGSRFIQQKLETASTAEKDMVFSEIMPQAITLMTDVFGNYVVQKFFEHGSPAQIKKLATKLNGRVLSLSLQMYGCRVIQKAIEVVDLEQQTQMVAELENSVMRCVHDQNGNHVIQKCIECVPQDVIHFIISTFFGHVVSLSIHSYGCRVIQRVLEHCDNPKTQEIVMNEILGDVMFLSQDQYGNYVVQHVLEHGKPHEKSAIIGTLAGQILNMSRQKYASNVVEKCLTFGSQAERQILIREMLGPTEENEALQEMMKDQFGNYVVQKVLETCSDTQREMILTRIKIHLTALKKYTYGKHIVARVEKLVAAGERRLGIQPGAFVSTA